MKTKIWLLIVLGIIFGTLALLGQCNRADNGNAPLTQDTFVTIYVDLSIATEKIGIGTPEYEQFRDSLLEANGTTSEAFIAMQDAYDTRPEEWAEVWNKILAELNRRQAVLAPPDTAEAGN